MRPSLALALFIFAGSCAGGQQAATPAPSDPYRVAISSHKFVPKTLTVPVGTTVTWENLDVVPHTVTRTADEGGWDSGRLSHHDTFTHRFTAPGTYLYICVPHPGMQGAIVVE
jgi:plastocyanin